VFANNACYSRDEDAVHLTVAGAGDIEFHTDRDINGLLRGNTMVAGAYRLP
jgi:hypothetical protein